LSKGNPSDSEEEIEEMKPIKEEEPILLTKRQPSDHSTIESNEEGKYLNKKIPSRNNSLKYKASPSDTNSDDVFESQKDKKDRLRNSIKNEEDSGRGDDDDVEEEEEDDVYDFSPVPVIERRLSAGGPGYRTLELKIEDLFSKIAKSETAFETLK
jgi:hypothetical protein